MQKEKIVAIEDESDILEVIAYNLSREGYEVISARDGEKGLRIIKREQPDLVLLDLMLPGLDGLEVCRLLKSDPVTDSIPIIMVTAKGEESDVVLGLGIGADDYVTKPFSPKELVARVRAVLRRTRRVESLVSSERIVRGGVLIDTNRHEVKVDGNEIFLTLREFRLLHYLASRPGRVFSRDFLLGNVFGDDIHVIDRNIDVHIGAIRKKLGAHRELIETIRGIGYRFRDEEE